MKSSEQGDRKDWESAEGRRNYQNILYKLSKNKNITKRVQSGWNAKLTMGTPDIVRQTKIIN